MTTESVDLSLENISKENNKVLEEYEKGIKTVIQSVQAFEKIQSDFKKLTETDVDIKEDEIKDIIRILQHNELLLKCIVDENKINLKKFEKELTLLHDQVNSSLSNSNETQSKVNGTTQHTYNNIFINFNKVMIDKIKQKDFEAIQKINEIRDRLYRYIQQRKASETTKLTYIESIYSMCSFILLELNASHLKIEKMKEILFDFPFFKEPKDEYSEEPPTMLIETMDVSLFTKKLKRYTVLYKLLDEVNYPNIKPPPEKLDKIQDIDIIIYTFLRDKKYKDAIDYLIEAKDILPLSQYHHLCSITYLLQDSLGLAQLHINDATTTPLLFDGNIQVNMSKLLYTKALTYTMRKEYELAYAIYSSLVPTYYNLPMLWIRLAECIIQIEHQKHQERNKDVKCTMYVGTMDHMLKGYTLPILYDRDPFRDTYQQSRLKEFTKIDMENPLTDFSFQYAMSFDIAIIALRNADVLLEGDPEKDQTYSKNLTYHIQLSLAYCYLMNKNFLEALEITLPLLSIPNLPKNVLVTSLLYVLQAKLLSNESIHSITIWISNFNIYNIIGPIEQNVDPASHSLLLHLAMASIIREEHENARQILFLVQKQTNLSSLCQHVIHVLYIYSFLQNNQLSELTQYLATIQTLPIALAEHM